MEVAPVYIGRGGLNVYSVYYTHMCERHNDHWSLTSACEARHMTQTKFSFCGAVFKSMTRCTLKDLLQIIEE